MRIKMYLWHQKVCQLCGATTQHPSCCRYKINKYLNSMSCLAHCALGREPSFGMTPPKRLITRSELPNRKKPKCCTPDRDEIPRKSRRVIEDFALCDSPSLGACCQRHLYRLYALVLINIHHTGISRILRHRELMKLLVSTVPHRPAPLKQCQRLGYCWS